MRRTAQERKIRRLNRDRRQYWKDRYLSPNRRRIDDRFVLRDGAIHPFAVICPGGAYRRICSYVEGVPLARRLNERGYSAFIVYYRVGKKARFPAPMEDLAASLREILGRAEEYRLEPETFSLWGASAGGHLAAAFGTASMGYPVYGLPAPAAMLLTYPVISMKPGLTHPATHDTLLGPEPGADLERMTSVEEQITADYPPTYLWCGSGDRTVPPDNTRLMAGALERAGVPCQGEIFPGVDHGVGLGTGTAAAVWFDHAVAFWEERIRARRSEAR